MSAEGNSNTTRTSVKVYVPAYQKQRWAENAEDLGMSQSEYVRSMVQAGRRGFEVPSTSADENGGLEADPPDATPGVGGLETRLLDILSTDVGFGEDELVERLTEDIEDRLYDALDDLQDSNRIKYSPRHGGYVLAAE